LATSSSYLVFRCLIAHQWWMKFMGMAESADLSTTMQLPPISNDTIVHKSQQILSEPKTQAPNLTPCSAQSNTSRGEEYELKPSLVESMDFVAVPERLFNTLVSAFGIASEGRDIIKREVIESKLIPKDGMCDWTLCKDSLKPTFFRSLHRILSP